MKESLVAVAVLLKKSREALAEIQPGDLDAIAACGSVVEETASGLPGGVPLVPSLLALVLEVLQRLYEGEAASPGAELASSREVLDLAVQSIEADQPEAIMPQLHSAGHGLWLLLGKAADVSPFVAAAKASPVPPVEAPRTLDDLAALLIGLQAEDAEEIAGLRTDLQILMDTAGWPAAAIERAREALSALALGTEEGLDGAGTALGRLADILEAPETLAPAPASTEAPAMAEPATAPAAATEACPAGSSAVPAAADDLLCLVFDGDLALLGEFVNESLEHLQNAEVALLELESYPDDKERLNAVFRGFHTIKGTAGFLGLPNIQKLAHHAEALLDRARKGELLLTGLYADLSLRAADMLKAMILELRTLDGGQLPSAPDDFENFLEELKNPEAAPLLGNGPGAEVTPAPQMVGETAPTAAAAAPSPSAPSPGSPEVHTEVAVRAEKSPGRRKDDIENSEVVRVRTDRLDGLINMVGELVIANAMLIQDEIVQGMQAQALGRKVSQINKITRELQALGTSMRMVPLKNTFQKMARVARDVGQKAGKQVRFVSEGEDTEIDRTMVEALGDPLLHMIRNAVDHGLETTEARVAAGKPETGTVVLRAYHAAGSVVIELQDDGRGLDRDKILSKAIASGAVEEGRDLTDSEVYKLVFTPGLSTAEKVTDVSGRGVGMDVVARNIEALHGRVEIDSAPGVGTTFVVRIPLTLAIMDGMLVRVGDERYIIPTISIQQALQATPEELSTLFDSGEVVMFRENLVPIVRLHQVFGICGGLEDATEAILVITESGSARFALMVDELLGQQQIVIKSLGKGLNQIPGVSGSAILGDGRVGLILDLPGIARLAEGSAAVAALRAS